MRRSSLALLSAGMLLALTVGCAGGDSSSDDDDSSGTGNSKATGGSGARGGNAATNNGGSLARGGGTSSTGAVAPGGAGSNSGGSTATGASTAKGGTSTGTTGGTSTGTTGGTSTGTTGGTSTGTTGGASTVGSGGTTTAVGGSTSAGGATSCQPQSMTGYTYPTYVAARHLGGSCTEAQVTQYYTDCFTGANCTAFGTGGVNEACGTCMAAVDLGQAASYGPLVRYGTGSYLVSETNTAGCIELLGEAADCAKKIQIAQLCEIYACSANCPVTDQNSYNAFSQCKTNARTTVCSAERTATACITDPAHATACSGSTFQDLFTAMGRVFCVETH